MFVGGENENLALMGVRREKSLQVTPHFRFGRGQPPRTRWFVGRLVSSGSRVALEHALDARMRESAGQERDMEPGRMENHPSGEQSSVSEKLSRFSGARRSQEAQQEHI